MPQPIHMYYSHRGIPLLYYGAPLRLPLLTVENYMKWYDLHIIHEDGVVEAVPFPSDHKYTKGDTPYCDHAPNPEVVRRFAEAKEYELHGEAYEMMIGRWELEYLENTSRYGHEGK